MQQRELELGQSLCQTITRSIKDDIQTKEYKHD